MWLCRLLKSNIWGRSSSRMTRYLSFESGDELPKKYYIRARRIILIRHGESEGNKDEQAYVHTPDWRIALTDKVCDQFACILSQPRHYRSRNRIFHLYLYKMVTYNYAKPDLDQGKAQAKAAGNQIRDLIGKEESVYFYVSPYRRTLQTMEMIKKQLHPDQVWGTREEPRIAEQQFGNFQVCLCLYTCKCLCGLLAKILSVSIIADLINLACYFIIRTWKQCWQPNESANVLAVFSIGFPTVSRDSTSTIASVLSLPRCFGTPRLSIARKRTLAQ